MLPIAILVFFLHVKSPLFIIKPVADSKSIKSTVVIKDEVMSNLDINRPYTDDLKTYLNTRRVSIFKNYLISLTKDKQLALANTTEATELRSIAAKNGHEIEILQNVDPFEFLREFKSPCWYNVNQDLRCLPYFQLIGAPKSGSTDVYNMTLTHPDFRPFKKEYHWLTRTRFCESANHKENNTTACSGSRFDGYTKQIALPLSNLLKSESLRISRGNKLGKTRNEKSIGDNLGKIRKDQQFNMTALIRSAVTADCSASTMWDNYHWPEIKENVLPLEPSVTNADHVYRLNNRTKIVAILRNPVTRLYSDYFYFDHTRRKGPHDFHRDVVDALKHFYDCLETYSIRSCVYSAVLKEKIKAVRLHIGVYFIHLKEWYRVFPKDQIFIMRLEDYSQHRIHAVLQLYGFLGLRNLTQGETDNFVKVSNSSNASNNNKFPNYQNSVIFEETRRLLYTFYKPFNQALAKLMEDPKFDYGPY